MNPSLAHFQLLRRLRQQLHLQGGVRLIYLFSDYPLAHQWLQGELDAHLRMRSLHLLALQPGAATDQTSTLIQPLLASPLAGSPRAFWLRVAEPAADWDDYRDRLLARLNESRAGLVRGQAFVVLVFPQAYQARAAIVAPDLWSIRVATFEAPAWAGAATGSRAALLAVAPTTTATAETGVHGAALLPQMQRWKQQYQAWLKKPGQQLSPALAWQLVEQLLELQQGRMAQAIAGQALDISRQLKTLTADAPQSLRDLSVSLDNVGNVARDLGQLQEARSAYRESLEISRQLKTLAADAPQSLRDLSFSLNKVGDEARVLGQL